VIVLWLAGAACDSGTKDGASPGKGDAGGGPQAGQGAPDAGGAAGSAAGNGAGGSGAMAGSSADAGAMTVPDAGGPGPTDDADGGAALSFADDIQPLLVGGCGNCHGSQAPSGPPRPGGPGEGSAAAPGKFAVDDELAAYAAVLPYVVAGDPDASALYIKISQDAPSTGGGRMPPALRQWDDASIAAVHDWIASGAPEH